MSENETIFSLFGSSLEKTTFKADWVSYGLLNKQKQNINL